MPQKKIYIRLQKSTCIFFSVFDSMRSPLSVVITSSFVQFSHVVFEKKRNQRSITLKLKRTNMRNNQPCQVIKNKTSQTRCRGLQPRNSRVTIQTKVCLIISRHATFKKNMLNDHHPITVLTAEHHPIVP